MKALVLINSGAGSLLRPGPRDEARRIGDRLRRMGIDADVRTVDGREIGEAVRAAVASPEIDMIVAGGGDGTLNAVASELIDTDKVFAALPLGTLNHLAKELGVPPELDAAVDTIGRGVVREMNVGEVNGRPFLLFSAIGLYADVIKHRDAQRRALGRRKWPAMVVAAMRMLARFPLMWVRMTAGGESWWRLTPAVYVSISEYQKELFSVKHVACRERQGLDVFVAARTSRLGTVWLLMKAMLGLVQPLKDYEAMCVQELQIDLRRRHVRIGIDGEVVSMETPLRYRLRRGVLRVMVPPPQSSSTAPGAG
jgi:diacylglycerol kinase family enzyme